MRLALAPKIAVVEEDLVVAEEVEDRAGDGVFNKSDRRSSLTSLDGSLIWRSIERIVIRHKYWKKENYGKTQ
jgi:hypothetical protein